ncbi:MAG: ribosome assembly RNA-binding protein YhbY [Bacillota bacterium]
MIETGIKLTGKQKRFLRAMGSEIEPIVQVGKGGVSDNLIQQVDEALEARELVKLRVLKNSPDELDDIAGKIAAATGAAVAQTIGHIILFYRPAKKPEIKLPS